MNPNVPSSVCAEKLLRSSVNTITKTPRVQSGGRARPNPSLNHRTPNGRLSWTGLRYAVHFLSPGQAILPSVSG